MQEQGRRHYEISLRQFYAWALRVAGHPAESLVQIDAALGLCRKGRNATRIVEFLHYDRSLVQAVLGNHAEALKSYQRYKQFAAAWGAGSGSSAAADALQPSRPGRVLEPFYVKRADRLLREADGARFTTDKLAQLCGVSTRTLQLGFQQFRGVSPVAHARNLRLERSHQALKTGEGSVSAIAQRHGFGSLTTFSIEYRRRFGETPRETLARSRRLAA
jgi:AraC-like DNA-binding protein